MPTNSTRTRVDDHRKEHIDTKGPKQRNHLKKLQTHNLPTNDVENDVENINSTNKGRDLLLANKPRIVPWRTERMLQRIQRHSRITLHRSTHSKWQQNQTEKLAMAWIDYKKAYDMVPHSCIINKLKIYKISDEVINFIEKNSKTWRVELTAGGRRLTEAKIQRGIFQGDALSPLLFIIAMMPLNHILRKCTAGYKLNSSQNMDMAKKSKL